MIVRTWHGCVPRQHADGFFEHLQQTSVLHSESIKGNLGAFFLGNLLERFIFNQSICR